MPTLKESNAIIINFHLRVVAAPLEQKFTKWAAVTQLYLEK